VAAAPVPARIIEKGLVSDGMVIPLRWSQNTAIICRCTARARFWNGKRRRDQPGDHGRMVMRVGELLIPIAEAMRRDLLGGSYISGR